MMHPKSVPAIAYEVPVWMFVHCQKAEVVNAPADPSPVKTVRACAARGCGRTVLASGTVVVRRAVRAVVLKSFAVFAAPPRKRSPNGRAPLPRFSAPAPAGSRDELIATLARFDNAVFAPPPPPPDAFPSVLCIWKFCPSYATPTI